MTDRRKFYIEFPQTEMARVLRRGVREGKISARVYRAARLEYANSQLSGTRDGLEELALELVWVRGLGRTTRDALRALLYDTAIPEETEDDD